MAFASLAVVLINAWMGARVVYSGLKPGVLTTHLALAMSLTGMLAYCAWRGTDQPWRVNMDEPARARLRLLLTVLLGCIIFTGIIGAQVRELTDEMSKFHRDAPRSEWIGELEQSWKYLLHRSFSWIILALGIGIWIHSKKNGSSGRVGKAVMMIILTQMILGVIMSQVHIYSWVQVLHVGLSAILLSLVWLWWFASGKKPQAP
jgi:cytochrome c oxidase assembly protein subunit 15